MKLLVETSENIETLVEEKDNERKNISSIFMQAKKQIVRSSIPYQFFHEKQRNTSTKKSRTIVHLAN